MSLRELVLVFEYRISLSACRFQYPAHPMSLPLFGGQFVFWFELFHFGGQKSCTLRSLCSRLLCFGPHYLCPLCCAPLPSSAPRNAFGFLCDCDVTGPNVTLLGVSFGHDHLPLANRKPRGFAFVEVRRGHTASRGKRRFWLFVLQSCRCRVGGSCYRVKRQRRYLRRQARTAVVCVCCFHKGLVGYGDRSLRLSD